MPVPSTIADLSTIAADNSPHGSESIGTSLDNYIRSAFAFIKQLSTRYEQLSTGSGASGTWGISITGNAATATSSLATPTIGDRSLKLATTAMFSNEFESSIASSGYQKLPSGLIIQWGSSAVTAGTLLTVTLPTTFPNQISKLVASVNQTNATANSYANSSPFSASQIKLSLSYGGPINVQWIAIGW